MTDTVLIPLGGGVVLELTREAYEAALRPVAAPRPAAAAPGPATSFVTAKVLAAQLSLPTSSIYEFARAGRIPCVRAGKHVRFDARAVLAALATNGSAP